MSTLTDRILEARHIACQQRADGHEKKADVWDATVNKLLDQLLDQQKETP